MAVVTFHGDGYRIGMARGVSLDPGKEFPESRRRMWDLEFLEQAAVRQSGGDTVATRADIDHAVAKIGGSTWIAPSANKIDGSSFGLVYLQSHDRQRSAPSRSTRRMMQVRGAAIQKE